MKCTETQTKLTHGEALDEVERDHALTCPECGALAATWTSLDATLAELDPCVPEGFADRVMASIAREANLQRGAGVRSEPTRWYERRWAGVLLSSAAALVALLNVARFVVSVLVPVGSFGGAP
jgi:anti-sigma factor RsiW